MRARRSVRPPARRAAGTRSRRRRSPGRSSAPVHQGSRGRNGRTTSSAAASAPGTSTPVRIPSRSKVAASTSVGALPAPAPSAHSAPSTWVAPAWSASTELATPSDRFWWPWKPTSACCPISLISACTRAWASAEYQGAGRVDDVDALRAGIDHDPGLRGQLGRARCGGPASGSRPSPCRVRGPRRSAGGHVGLGAVGGDPGDRRARVVRLAQIVHGADAGQQQHGDLGPRGLVDRGARSARCSSTAEKP